MEDNKFFDFITNEVGTPIVRTFRAAQVIGEDGRTHYTQTSDFVFGYTYDMESTVADLKRNDYLSWDKMVGMPFNVSVKNPLMVAKLALLSSRSVLLNKVYDDKAVIDGMHAVAKYVHYIDVDTGVQYVLCVQTDNYKPDIIEQVQEEGFSNIEGTVLKDFLPDLKYNSEAVKVELHARER